jgi:hypothetical protein
MRLTHRVEEVGATGYILLWLLGIPIPILLIIFPCAVVHKTLLANRSTAFRARRESHNHRI